MCSQLWHQFVSGFGAAATAKLCEVGIHPKGICLGKGMSPRNTKLRLALVSRG